MIWEPECGSATAIYHWKPFLPSSPVTACQRITSPQPEAACDDPWKILDDRMCPDCEEIWHMICTSVQDAKSTIQTCESIVALQGAYQLAEYVTLRNLLRSRLRKLGEIVQS